MQSMAMFGCAQIPVSAGDTAAFPANTTVIEVETSPTDGFVYNSCEAFPSCADKACPTEIFMHCVTCCRVYKVTSPTKICKANCLTTMDCLDQTCIDAETAFFEQLAKMTEEGKSNCADYEWASGSHADANTDSDN